MVDSVVAMRPAELPEALAVSVTGKIHERRKHNDSIYTTVRLKAVDDYTKPQVLNIVSDLPIGAVGEVVTVNCSLGGQYGKPVEDRDRHTGEIRDVFYPVRMWLRATDFSKTGSDRAATPRQQRAGSF